MALKSILIYLGVSDCDMEKGSLRCDANISLRPKGQTKLGTKTEIKNLNSFKAVVKALEFEANRQAWLLKEGQAVSGETRLWDDEAAETRSMRSKEEIQDYRYFPEPDLMPFTISPEWLKQIKASLPELPAQLKERFIKQYQLSEYDAGVLVQDKSRADAFEESNKIYPNPKANSNILINQVAKILNEEKKDLKEAGITPQIIAGTARVYDKGVINTGTVHIVISGMRENPGMTVEDFIGTRGLAQISDDSVIEGFVKEVISKNEKIVGDYKGGKKPALESLLGQVMKASKGKAQPDKVRQLLQKHLGS